MVLARHHNHEAEEKLTDSGHTVLAAYKCISTGRLFMGAASFRVDGNYEGAGAKEGALRHAPNSVLSDPHDISGIMVTI